MSHDKEKTYRRREARRRRKELERMQQQQQQPEKEAEEEQQKGSNVHAKPWLSLSLMLSIMCMSYVLQTKTQIAQNLDATHECAAGGADFCAAAPTTTKTRTKRLALEEKTATDLMGGWENVESSVAHWEILERRIRGYLKP